MVTAEDIDRMHVVRSWAFQGSSDPRDGLPNFHYAKVFSDMIESGELAFAGVPGVLVHGETGSYVVCNVSGNASKGIRESVEVRAPGSAVEAIGVAHDFALDLLGKCCCGYEGRL